MRLLPMEKEESTAPLLQQNNPGGAPHHDAAVVLSDEGQFGLQQIRSSDWRAPALILGYKCLEAIGYCAIDANLVIYLTSIFHQTNAASATNISTWRGTTFFAPLLGAIVADSSLGRHWTVLICATVDLLVSIPRSSSSTQPNLSMSSSAISNPSSSNSFQQGTITVTLSALLPSLTPPPCRGNLCPPASAAQNLVLFSGLYLVALGCGGAKSSLLPLGADQFYDENPDDRERKSSFISSFYLCIILGKLVSTSIITLVQENVSWALGFGLGTLSMALALGGFLLGTPIFRPERPRRSPLKSAAQVFVASLRKMHLDAPNDTSLLYELKGDDLAGGGRNRQLAHTDSFRFLDKAATVSDADMSKGNGSKDWRLCTVTQVEELKTLLRLLPIWISCVIYSSHSQISITFVEQGNAMDRKLGSFFFFSIPAASLQAFEVACVTCLSVLYDRVLVPIARTYTGNRRGLTLLQRIGVGSALLVVTMAAAATLEAERLEAARVGRLLSIAWQLPIYFLVACSEMFGSIGQLEFFYDQAPDSMKSTCSSLFLLSIALGSYFNSLFISFVVFLTTGGGERGGWLPDNLNEGHLDYILWILAALSTLNLGFYVFCAVSYTPKKVAFASEDGF